MLTYPFKIGNYESPFTGIEMQLVKEKEVLSYRKDNLKLHYSFE
jgi:hypothetical protein